MLSNLDRLSQQMWQQVVLKVNQTTNSKTAYDARVMGYDVLKLLDIVIYYCHLGSGSRALKSR